MEISNKRAILLLWSPDRPGIVAEVSHFIFTYGGNIIESSQHNDPVSDTFLMRIEWDLSGFALPEEKIEAAFEPIAMKFGMTFRIEFSSRVTRMAILVSQYDHCLYDLILRNREGETHAEICLIIGNHPQMKDIADSFGLPFHYTPMTKETKENVCTDPTQDFTVELPCRMVKRIERYAKENGTSVGNVLIEALDGFLRQ